MDEYRNIVREKLIDLSDEKKIIFSLLTCEKLLPNYTFFSNKYNYGNPSELEHMILILYQNVFQNRYNIDFEDYIIIMEKITPNTEDFDTILVSFALDACTAILSTLYFFKEKDTENIIDVATYARDTVDMYIQERDNLNINNVELELLIEQDSFMQNEKERQNDVIDYLKNIDSISQKDLERLRNLRTENIIDLNLL